MAEDAEQLSESGGGRELLRILHLISEKPPIRSGFSTVILRLTEELTKLGHEVDILSAQDCFFKTVGELKLVIGTGRIGRSLNGTYDIVHIHGHTPTFSDRLFLSSKLSGKKLAYTMHCPANYFLKPIAKIYNGIVNNFMLQFADAIIVTTKSYYDRINTSKKKYLIPWGVDHDKFYGERKPHDEYRLLFVGQMRPYKGIKILLQAVMGLDVDLSMVGDGPARSQYVNYVRKLGLNNVKFLGNVSDEELKQIYLNSDVLVLPSVSTNEAFGLVTLEAAAAGCAVVASDLPGLRDVVSEFGLLVRPNDPKSLKATIQSLENMSQRELYTSRGRSAVTRYSWRNVAEEYDKVYWGMLSGNKPEKSITYEKRFE
jgi:glycosyltransferase involved in cell wall biosynthesis